jgi:hypothetical protein
MVQSRTCLQKVARSYVRVVLPSGSRNYCGTSKAEPCQDDPIRSIVNFRRVFGGV